MTPLLSLLLACAPPDAGGPAPGAPEGPGGVVVAWGDDGLHVSDASGLSFTALTPERPDRVNVGDGTITSLAGSVATRWDPATGTPLDTFTFACTVEPDPLDALAWADTWYAVCGNSAGDAWAVRGEPDGTTTVLDAWANVLFADQGALYAREDLGREGTLIRQVDPTTFERIGDTAWAGSDAEPRGPWLVSWGGEVGNSRAGEVYLDRWDTPDERVIVTLPDGVYAEGADHLDDGPTLVRTWEQAADTAGGMLVGADGAPEDALPACRSPRLIARGLDTVEGWCTSPLTRYTWTRDGDAWVRTDEQVFDLDVVHLRVLEPGD